jgi:hypothetical protein
MMRVPQKFNDMSFEDHHLEGMVWPLISKRTGEKYSVKLTNQGFTCTCVGAQMHGKCKHIKHVHDLLVSDEEVKYEVK